MEAWSSSYTMEVWKIVLSRLGNIKYHKRFLCCGSVAGFIKRNVSKDYPKVKGV